jgi:hypothetical protein
MWMQLTELRTLLCFAPDQLCLRCNFGPKIKLTDIWSDSKHSWPHVESVCSQTNQFIKLAPITLSSLFASQNSRQLHPDPCAYIIWILGGYPPLNIKYSPSSLLQDR